MANIFKKIFKSIVLDKETVTEGTPLEQIGFACVQGVQPKEPLIFFGLSTCGFCKKAFQFLTESNLEFRYVYLDQSSEGARKTIRKYIWDTYGVNISYPFLCIGSEKHLSGFIRKEWEKELLSE